MGGPTVLVINIKKKPFIVVKFIKLDYKRNAVHAFKL